VDPVRRPPARRAGPVSTDRHLRPLADDVATEPDPARPGQLQADAGRLADGAGKRRGEIRWLEDDEGDAGTACERAEAPEPVRDRRRRGRPRQPRRQVDDEEIDRPARQQRAGDRDPLLRVGRGHDDEPLRANPAGDGLDRVERRGEVQPGHDRPGRLGLRGEPQGERRPAAREVAPELDAHAPRHATRAEDRVEGGEPGR
jgi:hypothetical protein